MPCATPLTADTSKLLKLLVSHGADKFDKAIEFAACHDIVAFLMEKSL